MESPGGFLSESPRIYNTACWSPSILCRSVIFPALLFWAFTVYIQRQNPSADRQSYYCVLLFLHADIVTGFDLRSSINVAKTLFCLVVSLSTGKNCMFTVGKFFSLHCEYCVLLLRNCVLYACLLSCLTGVT
jgi:hypothetical protein